MDWGGSEETTRLEVITIYRPSRVVAAVCCFIVVLMMIVSICPTAWFDARETPGSLIVNKEGLFKICTRTSNPEYEVPLEKQGCINQDKSFMKGVAALIIIGWLLMLAAGVLLTYGMLSHFDDLKPIFYRIALILAIITGVLLLIALITFPVMVSKELKATITEAAISVGWAYMLDWASLIVVGLVVALLAVDRSPDETSVREKVLKS